MKDITVKELRIGDIFIDNGTPRIVDKLIIKECGIVYVIVKFLNIDGEFCRSYDIFDNTYNVIKLSI